MDIRTNSTVKKQELTTATILRLVLGAWALTAFTLLVLERFTRL